MHLLETHSIFSRKKSIVKIDKLIEKAKELNVKSIALTDHDGIYGSLKLFEAVKKTNIKPIIGCELNFTESLELKQQARDTITLLVKNKQGYQNLCNLITKASTEGFYYSSRVDLDLVERYSNGLICCFGRNSIIKNAYNRELYDYVKYLIDTFSNIFEKVFIYISPLEDDKKYIDFILNNYYEHAIITNSINFLEKSDYEFYDFLMCDHGKNKISLFKDKFRIKANPDLYLKTEEELRQFFGERYNELCERYDFINDISFTFDKSPKFPKPNSDEKPEKILRQLLEKGLVNREKYLKYATTEEYSKRLEYEYEAIVRLGYASYFVIVADFIQKAKDIGIPVGDARGSVSGSLVAYLIGITEVDPIRYNLIFERFLDPTGQRITPPDIDIDFDNFRRDEVIEIIKNIYGEEKVVSIANLVGLAFKSSIKDSARCLDVSFEESNLLCKQIGFKVHSLEDLKNETPHVYRKLMASKKHKEILKYADGTSGAIKNLSIHAAGVIISPEPITNIVPCEIVRSAGKKTLSTQFDKKDVEKLGLVKMDILGLAALHTIDNCLKFIKQNHGTEIDLNEIDLNDPNIYPDIKNGYTAGIFQLEGKGMTQLAVEMQVDCLDDICDLIALYRPQVLQAGLHLKYLENRRNNDRKNAVHPALIDILEPTFGTIVYQEQNMQAAVHMAGFTLAEADSLRKATGRKTAEDIPILKAKFVEGSIKNGYSEKEALEVFAIFEDAGYSFNRGHSLSYSRIAAKTMWLKYYYPAEYLCAAFITESDCSNPTEKQKKFSSYFNEAKRLDIRLFKPEINNSDIDFRVDNSGIYYGLRAIKEIGEFASLVVGIRKIEGEFKSFADFLYKLNKHKVLARNKTKVKILVYMNCFYKFNKSQAGLIDELDKACMITKSIKTETLFNPYNMIESDDSIITEYYDEREYLHIRS